MWSNVKMKCECKEFTRTFVVSQGIVFAQYECDDCSNIYEQMIGETWKPEGKELKEWRVDK